MIYSADFETTIDPSDCRVWAWAYCDINRPDDIEFGNNIDSFMSVLKEKGGVYYFHNLKFDGNFIVYWLFKHGYKHVQKKKKDLCPKEFCSLISDMGSWYTLNISMEPMETGVSNNAEIIDSLKLIPLSVSEIPKAYGLDEAKGEIDYSEYRKKGHELTTEEKEYIGHDVSIVAKAIKFMKENGQVKLTAASNALNDFKGRYDKKQYNKLFPSLNSINDGDIRHSYKGGWTYLNPKYKNIDVKEGRVYDVNSMYPWAMKYCSLPWGEPYYFSGEYTLNKTYPLYVINFEAEFKLKPGHYPSIQIKGSFYQENEYIEKSIAPTILTLTSIDFELFKENYDYEIIQYFGGYMFKEKRGMFDEYIDYWYNQKTEAKKTGNKGMEKISKLMLNSLYGKFGTRLSGKSKVPYYDEEEDKVRYKLGQDEERKGGYLPVATFITSYCRDKIVRAANICGDRFIYADTDSVHVSGDYPVDGLDIDEYRLGAFKCEERFVRGRFIRQKTYMEIYLKNGKETMNLKCCGMPKKMKDSITEDDFYEGAIYDPTDKDHTYAPKLMPQVVSGGVILRETTFKIKKSVTLPPFRVIAGGETYETQGIL